MNFLNVISFRMPETIDVHEFYINEMNLGKFQDST